MPNAHGFTRSELVVTVMIVVALAAVLIPAIARLTQPPRGHGLSQVRGIHQGMVIYAESNNHYLPGLNAEGVGLPDGPRTGFSGPGTSPAARMWIMLNGNYFTGDLCINPVDSTKVRWTSGAVRREHFSFAMLEIGGPGARRESWRDAANPQAVLVGDRALSAGADVSGGAVPADTIRSVWTTKNGKWKGELVWADNHAGFTDTPVQPTRYGDAPFDADYLFEPLGTDDAFLIYDGKR
jgi:hypothetical protein